MADMNEAIREEFQCKVCLDYMHPPIRQCAIGHSFCNSCFKRVSNCPMCRGALTDTRSRVLENIHDQILFPCSNTSIGCEQQIRDDSMTDHMMRCPTTGVPCPVSMCDGCTWTEPVMDSYDHCTMVNMNEAMREEFQCKVCLDYMHPPIRQCAIGHSFCNSCFQRLSKCPMCRGALTDTRSRVLESIHDKIMFPCSNASIGCEQPIRGDSITDHIMRCPTTWIPCLISMCDGCTWTGPVVDFYDHCISIHKQQVMDFPNTLTLSNMFEDKSVPHGEAVYHLVEEDSRLFVSTWRINSNMDLLFHSLFYVGPQEHAGKFYYDLTVYAEGHPGRSAIRISAQCMPIHDWRLTQFWSNSIPIQRSMVRYCVGEKGLEHRISVSASAMAEF